MTGGGELADDQPLHERTSPTKSLVTEHLYLVAVT